MKNEDGTCSNEVNAYYSQGQTVEIKIYKINYYYFEF